MQPKKTCAYSKCKKKFKARGTKKYCSERCAYLAFRARHAEKPKPCKWCGSLTSNKNKLCSETCEQTYTRSKEVHPKKPKTSFQSINEIAKLARKAGLSYGQYVGRLYCEKERKN